MPRSSRSRSTSPQKMPSNSSNITANPEKMSQQTGKDILLNQIQEMFKGTVDPEVVQLVLSGCDWRVDDAIETLFSMGHAEQSTTRSGVSDLEVIACSLIGDAENTQNTKNSVSMGTNQNETLPQTQHSNLTSLPFIPTDKVTMSDKEICGSSLSYKMSDSHQRQKEFVEETYNNFHSYMAMSKIYGGYPPGGNDALRIEEDALTAKEHDCISQSFPPTDGITEITLTDKYNYGRKPPPVVQTPEKIDTCCSTQAYMNTKHTPCNSDGQDVLTDSRSNQPNVMASGFEKLAQMKSLNVDHPVFSQGFLSTNKGDNLGSEEKPESQDSIEEKVEGKESLREKDYKDDSEMFSLYNCVKDQLGNKFQHTEHVQSRESGLSARAPEFVPKYSGVFSPSLASGPHQEFSMTENQPWSTHPQPGPHPKFITPKSSGPNLQHGFNPFPKLQHLNQSKKKQPEPLQTLPFLANSSRHSKPEYTSIPGTEQPQIPKSFPSQTVTLESFSYSQAATNKSLIMPSWAVPSSSLVDMAVTMETEPSLMEQVRKVKSYVDQGKLLMVLLRGLPGSGKSYLAREIVFGGVILSTDDYFYRCGEYNYKQDLLSEAHNWNKQRARSAMDDLISPVIIDNTNTVEWEMLAYVRMAVPRGYAVEVMEPDTPWKFQPKVLCKKNSHCVTKAAIHKMNQRYQHNIKASAMVDKVIKEQRFQGMPDSRKVKDTKEPKPEGGSSVGLVEYPASSDEEEVSVSKSNKIPSQPPPPLPIQTTLYHGPQVVTKLKQKKTQPQKSNNGSSNNNKSSSSNSSSSNSSVPSSPRKRRRKKRRPSSSKSEVVQAIEEILECCKKGEITEISSKAIEEEIQALLFMSPVSDTDKKEIEEWLKERLEMLKKGGDTGDGKSEEFKEEEGGPVQDCGGGDKVDSDIDEMLQRTAKEKTGESLDEELDKIMSGDLSRISELEKPVLAHVCHKIDKDKSFASECFDLEGNGGEDDDDPWLLGQPKPRRNRRRRKNTGGDVEEIGKDVIKEPEADGQLEIEQQYWDRSTCLENSAQNQEVFTEMEREEVILSWDEPKPQREKADTGGVSITTTESSLPHHRDDKLMENVMESVFDKNKDDTVTDTDDKKVGEKKGEEIKEKKENTNGDCTKEPDVADIRKTENDPMSDPDDAAKMCEFQSLTETKNELVCELPQMAVENVENVDTDMSNLDEKEFDPKEFLNESEEEFKSFDSDVTENIVITDQEETKELPCDEQEETKELPCDEQVSNGEQPADADDSFLSVISSKDDSNNSGSSNLSFQSDVGENNVLDQPVEEASFQNLEKGTNIPCFNSEIVDKTTNLITSPLSEESNSTSDSKAEISDKSEDNSMSFVTKPTTDRGSNIQGPDIVKDKTGNIQTTSDDGDKQLAAEYPTDSSVLVETNVTGQDSSPQKCSTPKESKSSSRVRPGYRQAPFLDEEVKQKFHREPWGSLGKFEDDPVITEPEMPETNKQKIKPCTQNVYTSTDVHDFRLLEKPKNDIKIILGRNRDINLETEKQEGGFDVEKSGEMCLVRMLDKGSFVNEEDLQLFENVSFLMQMFPEVVESHLREALAICQGVVEWTIDLLLDWGSSAFSSVEKEEISHEMKMKSVSNQDKNLTTYHASNNPMSLFDICRNSIETNNLARSDELQKKLITNVRQRLKRMESHGYERVHSISLSESSFSVDNDSLVGELISHSQQSSDIYISPDKVFNDSAYGACAPSKERQLSYTSLADHQEKYDDWTVADNWTEEEKSMIDGEAHVKLPVPIELVRDLEELFGPVQSTLSDCEEFEVSLDLRTAKRLFDNLMRKPESRRAQMKKREDEEHALQRQLKDDEALARKLQEEEDASQRSQNSKQELTNPSKILREAKAAALKEGNFTVHSTQNTTSLGVTDMPRKKKSSSVNLMDIMEEERANQLRREEKMRRLEDDRVAISTKLKRQKLHNQFPGIDDNFLEEIFEANGYNLEDTVAVLQEAVGRGVSPRSKKLIFSTPEREKNRPAEEPASKGNLQDLNERSWQNQVQVSSYQTWDGADYEDIRGEANIHHQLRNECYQKAQEAFRRGMKEVAAFYSQQGHLHTMRLKEANKRASEKILEQRSRALQEHGTLDLHGFHVEEAIHILTSVIQTREEEFQARPDKRKQSLFVITGRGRHSKGGVAKLRPAIINHLKKTGYRYVEQPTGMFKIQLQYRA